MLAGESGADYVMFGEPDADGRTPVVRCGARARRMVGGNADDPVRRLCGEPRRSRGAGRCRRGFHCGRREYLARCGAPSRRRPISACGARAMRWSALLPFRGARRVRRRAARTRSRCRSRRRSRARPRAFRPSPRRSRKQRQAAKPRSRTEIDTKPAHASGAKKSLEPQSRGAAPRRRRRARSRPTTRRSRRSRRRKSRRPALRSNAGPPRWRRSRRSPSKAMSRSAPTSAAIISRPSRKRRAAPAKAIRSR